MSSYNLPKGGDITAAKSWLQTFGDQVGVEGLADKWTQGGPGLLRMASTDVLQSVFGHIVGRTMHDAIHQDELQASSAVDSGMYRDSMYLLQISDCEFNISQPLPIISQELSAS